MFKILQILSSTFLLCIQLTLYGQSLLQDLPILNEHQYTIQQSTYDRMGYNSDFSNTDNKNNYGVFFRGQVNNPNGTTDGKKEIVLCHIKGPCVIERFWMIPLPFTFSQHVRFYFDGESTPRIDKTFFQLFIEQLSPFNKPLVQEYKASSGGFWSYIPMPVNKDLVVTIDSSLVFSHFDVRILKKDTSLISYTTGADNSYLINELNKSGSYPKNNATSLSIDSVYVTLQSQETKNIFTGNGAQVIEAVKMRIKQLDYSNNNYISDEGRLHKGTSKATFSINGRANSVKLILRSNKSGHLIFNGIENIRTSTLVSADNFPIGFWQLAKYRDYRFWQNDTLTIPLLLYLNKTKLTLSFAYSSGEPWNEYTYWVLCDGVVTDTLNVGNVQSETAHNYSITNPTSGFYYDTYNDITARYPSSASIVQTNTTVLDSLYVQFYFDNEATPSISAPLGLFFATGTHDIADVKSLYCGHVNKEFYNYLSMPYWQNVRVELYNKSSKPIDSIWCAIAQAPNTYLIQQTGYLKGVYKEHEKTFTDGTDIRIASLNGKGKYIGTVLQGFQNTDTLFAWLEGDEHIYTDDAQTPFHIGTGMEDYFNSTFYFMLDEYSLPQNGMPNSNKRFERCMYRFHALDPISFQKNCRFQIEHGDYNNKQVYAQSLGWAYLLPTTSLVLTDSLDIGNTISENVHLYTTSNSKIMLNKNSAYEGEMFKNKLSKNGYALSDSSSFTVQILPQNIGVRLLRTFDYSFSNQYAEVWVDNVKVGEWFNAGKNDSCALRDDFFDIPEQYTRNKTTLNIRLLNKNISVKWTELDYKIYTKFDSSTITSTAHSLSDVVQIYPTLTSGNVFIKTLQSTFDNILIADVRGIVLRKLSGALKEIDLSALPNGYYLISVVENGKIIATQKVVLVH